VTDNQQDWARRHQTSCHEAGHALVTRLLNVPVHLVSLIPSKHFAGVTFGGDDPVPDDTGYPGLGVLGQPPDMRDWVERQIEISVAGPIGTVMAGPFEGRFDPTNDDWDNRVALAISLRTWRTRRLRSKKKDAKETPHDEETALERSRFLTWDTVPTMANIHHVEWLRDDTWKIMQRHEKHLYAIAAALLEKTELTGAELDAVMAPIRCSCHRWP
jgi:hypothetical protein